MTTVTALVELLINVVLLEGVRWLHGECLCDQLAVTARAQADAVGEDALSKAVRVDQLTVVRYGDCSIDCVYHKGLQIQVKIEVKD